MAWYKETGWFHRSRNHTVVRSTGRAVRQTSRAVHRLLALGTGVLVLTSFLLAGAAWRLSQGPINLGAWSGGLKAALADVSAPVRVSFDGMFLAWEGFHKGVDYPLDLRVSDIVITDPAGRRLVTAPSAHLTFSIAGLLLGRIVPRAIEVDHAQFVFTRDVGGAIHVGWDIAETGMHDAGSIDLRQLRAQLAHPASGDQGWTQGLFDQIRRAHFREANVTFKDLASALVIRTQDMDLDLVRDRNGHIGGSLRASLSAGDQTAEVTTKADWATGSGAKVDVIVTPFRPTGVGEFPPKLAFLAGIDAPVSLAAHMGFDAGFTLDQIRAGIQVGQGQIRVGQGNVPIRHGAIVLSGKPEEITITTGQFDLAHSPEGVPEIVDISGTVVHKADRIAASLTVGLGQIDIADLPRLWPLGIGSGARPWVTEHVTAGTITRGTAGFVIEADDSLRDIVVTKATGDLDGSKGIFTWIDNIPAIQQTDFHLHLVDPDTLDISISSARQQLRNGDADLLIKDGQMRITGLSLRDQVAVIRILVDGQLASTLSLLKEPRLHLLSTHPIALKVAGGDASATLDFQFPLRNTLKVDDITIHANAHLGKVRLLDLAGSQGLSDGVFDLRTDKDGMALKGRATIAAVPVVVDGALDFTSGLPDQVVQKIEVTGQPDAAQLDSAGLQVANLLAGPVPLTVVMIERRNGNGSIQVNGDLTQATILIDPLAWNKPSGNIADASATLLMSHDRVTKIDRIAVRGDGLLLTGSADFVDGRIRTLLLDDFRLGHTHGRGTVHLKANGPVAVVMQGDQLDLSPKLTDTTPRPGKPDAVAVTTPDWTFNARFDHAILANGESAGDVLVKATGGGQTIRLLDAIGTMQAGSGFSIKIVPDGGGRHLLVEAKDAGSFLRGVDAVQGIQAGHLMIDAILERPFDFHPLAGKLLIDNAIVSNSPVLGKLLQAVTVYGLVDALRERGMRFSHIIIPFHYDGVDLSLDQAHAYNSSLGFTADGHINLSSKRISLTGTVVPAYFFNSALGQLPLVGKLFSPERGGGFFAARFDVSGQVDDPKISINPISALTPGFLRGIFDMFGRTSADDNVSPVERK